MALRTAIGSCSRIQWWRARAGPRRSLAGRSCEGSDAAPCPPCPPQPPPPCRGLPPERMRAKRVVCCPPPQGNPPPCAPPCINPPLTCAEGVTKTRRTGRVASCAGKEVCGVELDRVALRLEKAKQYRRQNYEQEAAQRKACREPFPELVSYSLGAERECCHATDGKDYHVVKCGPPETPPCGPNRTPPPPRCVELVRDTECQVRGPRHVDPCAHKPRTIVEIDRSRQREPIARQHTEVAETRPEKATTMCGNQAGSAPPTPTRKFTTRLMESLSLTRNTEATKSCPRRSCDGKCDGEGARRAGDHGWCSKLKPPPAVPPPCRKPTRAELLKQRPPSRCGPNDPRCFHTAAALGSKSGEKKAPNPVQMKADTEKLEKALKERESYNEAGQGRVATEEALSSNKSRNPTASLDVCIPPGAEKLSVRVLVDEGDCKKKPKCKKPPKCKEEVPAKAATDCGAAAAPPASAVGRCHSVATNHSEKRESWLSIKSLLANCRKDNAHTPTCPTTKAPKNPCGSPPPAPPSKAPPAPSPCKPVPNPSPSKAPPRTSPCRPPAAPSPCNNPSAPSPSPCNKPSAPSPSPCNKPNAPSPSPCNKPNAPSPSPCKPATPPSPCKKDQPTKPKQDPCSSKKTKFTPEKTLELETFLLKW